MAQAAATVLCNVAGAASLLSQQKQPSCHSCHSQPINLACHSRAASSISSAMWGGKLKSRDIRQNHRQQSPKRCRSGVILATAETGVETKLEPATGVKFAKQGVSQGEDDLELLGAGKAQGCGSIKASYCCQTQLDFSCCTEFNHQFDKRTGHWQTSKNSLCPFLFSGSSIHPLLL